MAAKKKDKKERDTADTHSLPDHTKEKLARSLKCSPDLAEESKEQLIHKLQDLQIHLEMQAEELRRSHLALEVSRDKYLDLYDFAPIGYLTLNDNALITDVNLTGAMLFGAERNEIINHRFEQFITPEDFERWYRFFANIQRQHVKKQVCTFEFIREDGSTFPAQLEGVRTISSDGAIEIHIAISDITDIREAEKALRESEEKYRVIFENSVTGLFKTNPDGALIAVNDAFARIYDYSNAAEMTADNQTRENLYISSALYANPEDRKEMYRILAEKGKVENFETLHCKRDGTRIWMSITARVVRDPEGTILFIEGTVIDITKRKQAEDALRESEGKLNAMLQSIADPMSMMDADLNIIWANATAKRYFGKNLVGRKCYEAYHQRQQPCEPYPCITLKAFQDREVHRHDTTMIDTHGKMCVFECLANVALTDKKGNPLAVLEISRDITESKRVEDALRESHDRFEATIASLDDAIFLVDPVTRMIIECNDASTRIFGYSREELVGRGTGFLHVDQAHLEEFSREVNATYDNPGYYSREFKMRRKNGGVFPTEHFVRPIKDPDGRILYVVSVVRDITERKKAEETIRHALAEKEVLLREIHHRVKNNLSGILSLIELQTSSLSDPVQIAPFKELESRIRSMALVHESLSKTKDLARIYLASYTENLTRYLLPSYGTAVEVKCKIEMGYITLPIENAIPCGLVMNEIVTNSLKYAFPKTFSCKEIRGEPCTITLTLQREGSDYILGVADNGIGIPEGIDVTISHTLGLFLIRFIVEHQLRGSLEISNAGGTAYTIRFPEPAVKERSTNEKM